MSSTGKNLPPLPLKQGNGQFPSPLRSPPPLSQRPFHQGKTNDKGESIASLQLQLKRLRAQNDTLKRNLAAAERERDELVRRMKSLEVETAQQQNRADIQNEMVVQIANTISEAFQQYQDAMQQTPNTSSMQQGGGSGDILVHYSDLLSVFSEDESE
ncbi:hypothetical protein QBC35DRAFT_457749 [Podospora australis]|uniref:Uncharacterized protein n=1 Tax=Podospora australis TaxID=1536484 RepID=A0AAN7ADN3_9PEZI|nr:hypothetical protein QBC35DRAFT_457749 [Podospora australis]